MSMDIEEELISKHHHFYDDLYLDSLSFMNLIVLIEHYFEISIEDNLFDRIYTISELQAIIQLKVIESYGSSNYKQRLCGILNHK